MGTAVATPGFRQQNGIVIHKVPGCTDWFMVCRACRSTQGGSGTGTQIDDDGIVVTPDE